MTIEREIYPIDLFSQQQSPLYIKTAVQFFTKIIQRQTSGNNTTQVSSNPPQFTKLQNAVIIVPQDCCMQQSLFRHKRNAENCLYDSS
jgi:hypothetical protein